jgi:hypothetical protein
MDETCVVYVVSSDWQFQAYVAIHSLLSSGSDIDRVIVLMVGGGGDMIKQLHGPVVVREVPDINPDFFLANKTQITSIDADRLVFLDADTAVLRPLEHVWENCDSDVIARVDNTYEKEDFPTNRWNDALSLVDAPEGPYLSSGFIVFQNAAQEKIGNAWRKICSTYRKQYKPKQQSSPLTRRFAEQMAFGASVFQADLSYKLMSPEEHAYAWTLQFDELGNEVHPIVYHACGPYVDQAVRLERKDLIDFSVPVVSSRLHPYYSRLQYRRWLRWAKDIMKSMIMDGVTGAKEGSRFQNPIEV